MIIINIDSVFSGDWSDSLEPKLARAMMKAILDNFSGEIIYESGGMVVTPDEAYSETIEAGIGEITTKLNGE